MYGVDTTKPGAQSYYNSPFKLYAAWGVDYIKVDDISSPFREGEIAAVHKAIKKSGRKIVLSLSPSQPPERSETLKDYANLWRISDDFWDRWVDLKKQFEYAGPGNQKPAPEDEPVRLCYRSGEWPCGPNAAKSGLRGLPKTNSER